MHRRISRRFWQTHPIGAALYYALYGKEPY
jgi:hypothetical protein